MCNCRSHDDSVMCCSGNLRPPTQTSLITLLEYLHSGHDRGFGQQLEILRSILLLNGVLPTRSSQSMHPLRSDADDFSLLKEESCNYDCSCMDIIQSLLWAFPKLAWTLREKDRALPLHIAALIGNLNLARILAAAYPGALLAQNVKGKTPLHFAAREGHKEMVQMFLQLNPTSATITTTKLKLPLHFAAAEGHTEICQIILAAFPEGATARSTKGKLPLHLASRWGNMDTVSALLSSYPEGLVSLDWESSPPLHIALTEGNIEIARHLIQQNSGALKVRNIHGELPIDIALKSAPLVLFNEMINAWPESGMFALQKFLYQDDDDTELEWCKIDLCLQAAAKKQEKKYLPLHLILELSSSPALVRRVLAVCPDMIEKEDEAMRLPLHVAVSRFKDENYGVTLEILEAFPFAAKHKDIFGRLPLHVALTSKAHVSVVSALLKVYPESGVQECERKSNIPLHMALEYQCNIDVVFTLFRQDPMISMKSSMLSERKSLAEKGRER